MLRRAVPAVFLAILGAPAHGAEEEALLRRDTAPTLPFGVAVDHGGAVDPDGSVWVAVRADAAILDALPPGSVRARHAVPQGPPPAGLSLPEGNGRQRFDAAVDAAERAGRVSLGASVQGREVIGAWFGQPPEAGAPSLSVIGGLHGDEVAGYEAALWVADWLAAADGTDPEVTAVLDARTVWVVPWANPDGVMEAYRYNALRVDLNRNFDVEWRGTVPWAGPEPFSEPETRALRQLGDLVRPAAGLALHSGAANIGYVWNHTEEPAPDREGLMAMADRYADACRTDGFYVTNGAAWYITHGDSNDWAYGRYGSWEFTLELSRRKLLPPEEVQVTLAEHTDALQTFVLQPLAELTVVDGTTGAPLEAWVEAGDGQRRWARAATGRVGLAGDVGDAELVVGALGYGTATARPGTTVALLPRAIGSGVAVPEAVSAVRTVVRFPGAGAVRTLVRPGEDPVVVAVDRVGRGSMPAHRMRPGFWSVEDGEGNVYLRAIAVGAEPSARWPSTSEGARAFALGPDRELVEVSVEAPSTPLSADAVYLVDAAGERVLIPASPPGEGVRIRGAACASGGQTGHFALVVVSVLVSTGRRSRRERAGAHGEQA